MGSVSRSKNALIEKILKVVQSEICGKSKTTKTRKSKSTVQRKSKPRIKSASSSAASASRSKRKRWAVGKVAPSSKKTRTRAPLASATTNTRGVHAQRSGSTGAGKRRSKVYVLQLQGGYVYVGKTSRSIKTRLAEHMSSSAVATAAAAGGGAAGSQNKTRTTRFGGAAFTRVHPPTGKLLKRLGNLEGDGDGPERDETLRQMHKRGPQKVRGWKYVRPGPLTKEDLEDIERNMRELFDMCRKCGKRGHFSLQCSSRAR